MLSASFATALAMSRTMRARACECFGSFSTDCRLCSTRSSCGCLCPSRAIVDATCAAVSRRLLVAASLDPESAPGSDTGVPTRTPDASGDGCAAPAPATAPTGVIRAGHVSGAKDICTPPSALLNTALVAGAPGVTDGAGSAVGGAPTPPPSPVGAAAPEEAGNPFSCASSDCCCCCSDEKPGGVYSEPAAVPSGSAAGTYPGAPPPPPAPKPAMPAMGSGTGHSAGPPNGKPVPEKVVEIGRAVLEAPPPPPPPPPPKPPAAERAGSILLSMTAPTAALGSACRAARSWRTVSRSKTFDPLCGPVHVRLPFLLPLLRAAHGCWWEEGSGSEDAIISSSDMPRPDICASCVVAAAAEGGGSAAASPSLPHAGGVGNEVQIL
eukprot:Rhum_TRINITY_DN11380_c2_g1::Rhum_TRINITY_DN11380_c2_g1_i1::g.44276::m.44276